YFCALVLILCRHSKRTELPKPFFGIIIADETSGVFELCNKGIKGTVLMMRRAKKSPASMKFCFDLLRKCSRETGLANTGLAGAQHYAPFAALSVLPAAQQYFDLLSAPDQGQRLRM